MDHLCWGPPSGPLPQLPGEQPQLRPPPPWDGRGLWEVRTVPTPCSLKGRRVGGGGASEKGASTTSLAHSPLSSPPPPPPGAGEGTDARRPSGLFQGGGAEVCRDKHRCGGRTGSTGRPGPGLRRCGPAAAVGGWRGMWLRLGWPPPRGLALLSEGGPRGARNERDFGGSACAGPARLSGHGVPGRSGAGGAVPSSGATSGRIGHRRAQLLSAPLCCLPSADGQPPSVPLGAGA